MTIDQAKGRIGGIVAVAKHGRFPNINQDDAQALDIALGLLEREPLVQEVIGTVREMFGAPITMDAYCERRERLVQVARKLSEWKP